MADSRIRFLNPNAAPATPPGLGDSLIAVWSTAWKFVLLLGAVTIVCALLYDLGSSHGWGIQPTFTVPAPASSPSAIGAASAEVSLADCIHFSLVTVTTLGYGDFRPVSYGRAVADAEVVLGLLLMGFFVSRLVSRQQDSLTKRIIGGQLNSEIQHFRNQIAGQLVIFRNQPPLLTAASHSQWLHDAGALTRSIASYWRYEAQNADLGEVVPVRPASRLLGDLITMIGAVSSSLNGKSRADLNAKDFIAAVRVVESTLTTATVLADRMSDQGTKHLYSKVAALVEDFRGQFELHPKAKPAKSTRRSRRRERRANRK